MPTVGATGSQPGDRVPPTPVRQTEDAVRSATRPLAFPRGWAPSRRHRASQRARTSISAWTIPFRSQWHAACCVLARDLSVRYGWALRSEAPACTGAWGGGVDNGETARSAGRSRVRTSARVRQRARHHGVQTEALSLLLGAMPGAVPETDRAVQAP